VQEVLRDKYGRIAGYISEVGDDLILYDKYGKKVGRYSKARGVTYDKHGRVVGWGNWLSALLVKELS